MMNTLEKINIPLTSLIGGAQHSLNLFRIHGQTKGPHVHIQSSVHGAEVQGNAVIFKLIQYFLNNDFKGSITFIPHANPISANLKAGTYTQGRFNGITGENWNRIYTDLSKEPEFAPEELNVATPLEFKKYLYDTLSKILERESNNGISLEKKLGLTLQKISAPADIVLDLHTGPIATRYLYVGQYARKKAQDFPFPFKLIIPNDFAGAMDEATFMPWIKASAAMGIQNTEEIPFESYTVELGSEEKISFEDAQTDSLRILQLLQRRGFIEDNNDLFAEKNEKERWCHLDDYKSYYAPMSGLVEYLNPPGECVKAGEPLYRILNFAPLASNESINDCLVEIEASEDSYIINHTPSSNIQEGMMVYQVMTNLIE